MFGSGLVAVLFAVAAAVAVVIALVAWNSYAGGSVNGDVVCMLVAAVVPVVAAVGVDAVVLRCRSAAVWWARASAVLIYVLSATLRPM